MMASSSAFRATTPVSSSAPERVLEFSAVRMIPWANANINYTGRALIVSGASIAAYFITADKTILKHARKNSLARYDRAA
ncbi:early nodulin-93-like isoform X2 [Actinidia eriantha]|uniref:early nodulin-93-like isoform X2 n=1 Tax=Actinidia eriantha TaxID=165200 RepID=UPI00258918CE|nr:early nodulin-93-like isoform X2 [Actinidia eriantha]